MNKEMHFGIWKEASKQALTLNSTLSAAGTAYFAFLSFFPFVLLIVAVASRWFDPLWVENELVSQMEFIIPGISNMLGENLEKIIQARGSVTISAVLVLAWSGSTLFSIITRVLDTIWSGSDVRSGLRYRGLSLLFVIGLALISLPLLFLGTWLTPIMKSLLPDVPALLHQSMGFIISILINIALFATLYRFLPHADSRWADVWGGAIAAGILWAIAKSAFLGYTASFLSPSNLVYGSVSAIIAFLTWAYLSGLIFFFGAYLGAEYSRVRKKRDAVSTP